MNAKPSNRVIALVAALLFASTGRAADVETVRAIEAKREKTKMAVLDLRGSANVDRSCSPRSAPR